MESKKQFGIRCMNKACDVQLEDPFCTYEDLTKMLAETPCPKCGGELQQTLSFGSGRFRGSGFTKRGC